MNNEQSVTALTPPGEEPRAFEVRSPEDEAQVARYLRGARGATPSLTVLIAAGSEPAREPLIEAMLPSGQVPAGVDVLQARRNAEARWRLLSEFGALSAAEVAAAAGSRSRNASALAGRWLREGRVVAVTHRGARYFPAFQFDEAGRPLAAVGRAIEHLGDLGEWQRALWFLTASSLLSDRRPVDLLRERPDEVVRAAEADAAAVD